jgi:hypothetical protein
MTQKFWIPFWQGLKGSGDTLGNSQIIFDTRWLATEKMKNFQENAAS